MSSVATAKTATSTTTSARVGSTIASGGFEPCDTCGHRSDVQAALPRGTLTFCAHHFHQYERGLLAAGAVIEDSRSELLGA